MNVIQSSRTMMTWPAFQQMKGIFFNKKSSFYFIKQMKRRSHAGPDMTRVAAFAISAAILPAAVLVPRNM